MTNKSKVSLCILAAILAVVIILYVLVDAVASPMPEQVVYPEGELADSVFVAQNNSYQKNDALGATHVFESIPYDVDVQDCVGAKIGTGTVYQVGSGYFIYVSEYTDQHEIQEIISSQFPVALLINYVPEATRVTVQQDRSGYINGFKAQYLADTLSVSDGCTQAEAMVLGYALDIPEGPYFGNHMFIAVGTTNMTSESANISAQLLSNIIKTVRFDENKNKELEKVAEEARKKQEELEEDAISNAVMESEEVSEDMTESVVDDETVSEWPVSVPKDCSVLTVDVKWTLDNPDAVLELFVPDGSAYIDPSTKDNYGAQFKFFNATAGTYLLRIKNYQQCGEVSVMPVAEPTNESSID